MEAFTTLVRGMTSAELKAGYSSVEVKGLRIHVGMEEFMERRKLEKEKERERQRHREKGR